MVGACENQKDDVELSLARVIIKTFLNVFFPRALLVVSDAFLHPIHIEYPDWFAAIDSVAQQTANTRHRLLNLATEKTMVFAFHFPFPGLGHIVHKREAWQWQPIEKI